jgi:sec-independent protein translocase protein TatA
MPVVGEIVGWEFLLILLIVLLLFGSARLPKLARSLGEAARELRAGNEDEPPRAADGDGSPP